MFLSERAAMSAILESDAEANAAERKAITAICISALIDVFENYKKDYNLNNLSSLILLFPNLTK